MRGLKVRGAGRRPVTAGGAREGARLTRLEVGDGPDGRVPPVSDWSKKKRERGGAGPAGLRSWANWAVCVRARRRKGLWPDCLRVESLLGRWEKEKEREREREKGFLFLLKFLFKFIFQTFNLQSNKIHAFES
jgi:hypothetical protein